MWQTSINLTSVHNGWIAEVVFQYIPSANESELMAQIAQKRANIERRVFTDRVEAVKWLSERLLKLEPFDLPDKDNREGVTYH